MSLHSHELDLLLSNKACLHKEWHLKDVGQADCKDWEGLGQVGSVMQRASLRFEHFVYLLLAKYFHELCNVRKEGKKLVSIGSISSHLV